jgi:hypothetical protein
MRSSIFATEVTARRGPPRGGGMCVDIIGAARGVGVDAAGGDENGFTPAIGDPGVSYERPMGMRSCVHHLQRSNDDTCSRALAVREGSTSEAWKMMRPTLADATW